MPGVVDRRLRRPEQHGAHHRPSGGIEPRLAVALVDLRMPAHPGGVGAAAGEPPFAGDAVAAVDHLRLGRAAGRSPGDDRFRRAEHLARDLRIEEAGRVRARQRLRHAPGRSLASAAASASITRLKVTMSAAPPPSVAGISIRGMPASSIAAMTSSAIRRSRSVRSAPAAMTGARPCARATQSIVPSLLCNVLPRPVNRGSIPHRMASAQATFPRAASLRRLRQHDCAYSLAWQIGLLYHPRHGSSVVGRQDGSGSFGCIAGRAWRPRLAAAPSQAQDAYPTRTVRFVVPFPAGSGTDVLSRLLADALTRKWGRTVISENVPGRVRQYRRARRVARRRPTATR